MGRPRGDTQKLDRATFRTDSNLGTAQNPAQACAPAGRGDSCPVLTLKHAGQRGPGPKEQTPPTRPIPARAAPAARRRGKAVHTHPVGQHSQHKDHSSRPRGQAARGARLRWRAADPQGTTTTGGAAPYEAASSGSRGFRCPPVAHESR